MRKRIITIITLMCVAVGTLYALNVTSNAPNRVKNGFSRKFLAITGHIEEQLEFQTPVRELAGRRGDSLFLMTGQPGKVYVVNSKLGELKTIILRDPKIKHMIPRFYTTVQYPEIFIFGGNAAAYAFGNLETRATSKVGIHAPGLFSTPVMVGDRIIMRVVDTSTFNARFAEVDLQGNVVKWENGISKGQRDAGFVYTGILNYDAITNQLVYLHFYDNGFEVFSPELKLIYRGNTIDTTFHNPTQVAASKQGVAYKHPPVDVNGFATVYGGKLYVSSMLVADNEDKATFYENTVVDRYDILNSKYEGSFYLPNIKGKRINHFYLLDDRTVLAFMENSVLRYTLKDGTVSLK